MNGMGNNVGEQGLVPFRFITTFILILKPLWASKVCLGTKDFAKQIRLMHKDGDDANDAPQPHRW